MQYSLFDIESTINGSNRDKYEFTLELVERGELKPCPLLEHPELFGKILQLSNYNLASEYGMDREFVDCYRLFSVYQAFCKVFLLNFKPNIPQHNAPKYNLIFDESYIEYISNLTLEDMKYMIDSQEIYHHACPIFFKEYANRTYGMIGPYYDSGAINTSVNALYAKIALENGDNEYYNKLVTGKGFENAYKRKYKIRDLQLLKKIKRVILHYVGRYTPSKLWAENVYAREFLENLVKSSIPRTFLIYPITQQDVNYMVELLLKYSNVSEKLTCERLSIMVRDQQPLHISLKFFRIF